jgi:hypothetical protein
MQKGCRKTGKDCASGKSCLNSNMGYSTYEKAIEQCGRMSDCEGVMEWIDRTFYLRSGSDPPQKEDVIEYVQSVSNIKKYFFCALCWAPACR